jgi:DNA helicase-2/ATP-dependent DNA helicase PcrA
MSFFAPAKPLDRKALLPVENHFAILGAPGSGKTTALVGRIAEAVEESMYGGDILICSLTKTAAVEIAARVKAKLHGVEFPHVGTVHALALRALKSAGYGVNMIYEEEHVKAFNQEYGRRLPLRLDQSLLDAEGSKADLLVLAECDRLRAAEVDVDHWPERCRLFHSSWTQFKVHHDLLDFTDLIEVAIREVPSHPADPAYIFVDEAQDLSALEMRLIKLWARSTQKTIVAGDDQQALYEWRGASVKAFIDFAPEENQYVLPRSYRMSEAIYNRARKFGDSISIRIEKEFEPVGQGGDVLYKPSYYMVNDIMAEIKRTEEVMLLASCGYILNPYLQDLRKQGVPYHNPYRSRAEGKTWNPLSSRHAEAFRVFHMPAAGQQMWTWPQFALLIEHLEEVPEELRSMCAANRTVRSQVPEDVVDRYDLLDFLLAAKDGDHMAFFNLLKRKHRLSRSITTPDYIRRVIDKHGWSALHSRPRLVVGTIHSVKGGEADTVYLLPQISPQAHVNMRNQAGKDSINRVFYVGASRARHKLIMVRDYSTRRKMW